MTKEESFNNDERRITNAMDAAAEKRNYLLDAAKLYIETEKYYHGIMPVFMRPVTHAMIEAIEKESEKDTETKKVAKEISDNLLKDINIITDQYRKDHNIKPI